MSPCPQVEALFHRPQLGKAGDALAPCLLLEVRVLHRQKLLAGGLWLSQVEQGAQQPFLSFLLCGNLYPGAVGALFQQLLDEVEPPLFLCHGEPSLAGRGYIRRLVVSPSIVAVFPALASTHFFLS